MCDAVRQAYVKNIVQAFVVPALAKYARAGHPTFQNGKGLMVKGWATRLPNPWIMDAEQNGRSCLSGAGPLASGQSRCGANWMQRNQDCLDKINNTWDGKFYNSWSYLSPFLGPDAGWGAFGEDRAKDAAQKAGEAFFKAGAKNLKRTALGSLSGVVSEGWEMLDAVALAPLQGAATAGQLAVHIGCAF